MLLLIIAILASIILILLGIMSEMAPGSDGNAKGCLVFVVCLWIIGFLIYGGIYWW